MVAALVGSPANASGSPTPAFTDLYMATLRPATLTPTPESGTEAWLTRTGSKVVAQVSGAGGVVVQLAGQECLGSPLFDVTVDGVRRGTFETAASSTYKEQAVEGNLPAGQHRVEVTFLNDRYRPGRCDRNLIVAGARMQFPAGAIPSEGNTGVPEGTPLKVHDGDLIVTKDGTTIDGLDVRGTILVKANNVTIKRSLIRGSARTLSSNTALIANWWGNTGLVVEDSTLRPDVPSYWLDGLSGANFSASRLDVSRVIDGVKIIGDNVTVENSWVHDHAHFSPDPTQRDNKSHDDGIQVIFGANLTVRGNLLANADNAAVMISQGQRATTNVAITANWLRNGGCTVNIAQGSFGQPIQGLTIDDNKFGTGRWGTVCAIRSPRTSPVLMTSNVWESNASPVSVQLF